MKTEVVRVALRVRACPLDERLEFGDLRRCRESLTNATTYYVVGDGRKSVKCRPVKRGERLNEMNTTTTMTVSQFPSTSVAILTQKGVQSGTRYFMGSLGARALKDAGRALGLKGSGLGKYVNQALRDETANRNAVTAATVSALASAGYVGDVCEKRAKSAVVRFVNPGVAKGGTAIRVSTVELDKATARIAELEAKLALMAK